MAAGDYFTQFTPLSPMAKRIFALSLILLMAVINVRGTRESAAVQNVATGFKVIAILSMSAVLFALGHGRTLPPGSHVVQPLTASGVGLSICSVWWADEG
ncbi:MAG: amino acid permease, partial [bacterium]